MNNFWTELPRPFFVLAPMEAVTDVVFRHVVAAAAPPDVYFTEFTNATGWAHAGDKAIGGRLIKTDDENPIVAQLWGSIPEDMEKLAIHCAQMGYNGIDINMGCPDASAVKSGGGAGMILNPENAAAMIASAKKGGLPVSVKTRLGYSRTDEWVEWLSHILRQDIVNLTIHLRTKKEMSKVPAHFELIADIKKLRDEIAPQTLLTINGDIEDRAQGMELVEKYGVDGIMIGRGIFHNPFAFAAMTADTQPGKEQLLNLLRFQLDLHDHYDAQLPRKFDPLKRFFKIYIRDFAGAAELRDQLMHAKTTKEVRDILSQEA
jgi:tRNA-dihydrouridine synthase